MASVMFNTKLNKYFIDNVQMKRDETSRIVADVMPDIEDIVKCISDMDPRFGAEAQHIGSYYQGLKVKRADEFDLSIPLQFIGQLRWVSSVPMRFGFDKPEYNYKTTLNQELSIVPSQNVLQHPGKEYITTNLSCSTAALKYQKLMFGQFLIPFLVKLQMKVLLHKALSELQLRGTYHYFQHLVSCNCIISILYHRSCSSYVQNASLKNVIVPIGRYLY